MKNSKILFRRICALLLTGLLCLIWAVPAFADYDPGFEVSSQGVYLVNTDSDVIIYTKNPNERMAPASMTKIMSAIVILENCKDLDGTTVTAEQWMFNEFYGLNISNAGIVTGETLTMRQLLYCMLLQSANEAASIAAYKVGDDSIPHFVEMMNETAQRIGATDTHFVNAHGLDDPDHYSTPHDMYLIARYATELPGFTDIVSQTVWYMEATNMVGARTLVNTNKLMSTTLSNGYYYYEPVTGIKTGTTPDAGFCVTSSAEQNGIHYICVCMGSPYYDSNGNVNQYNGAFLDTRALYEWAFSTFSVKELLSTGDPVDEVPLSLSWDRDYILLVPEKSFSALVPNDINEDSVQLMVNLPTDGVKAPVEEGQIIGSVRLILSGEQIGEVNLIASESVERSDWLYFLDRLKSFLTSLPFLLCLCAFLMAVTAYIVYMVVRNRRVLGDVRYKRHKPGLPKR